MNYLPSSFDPVAEEAAALWAARLDGSVLSADDRQALDAWLAAHADHRALLSSYCQFSADLEQQLPLIAGVKELSAEVQPTPATARPFPWLRWPTMAGVALTAAAAIAVVLWVIRPTEEFRTLATPAAQRGSLTLADGTKVELNAQTSLQVEINGQQRRVRLAAGEAFFSVHKDPQRPFVVETPAGSVKVTGTKFAVRAEVESGIEVTVLEGSVQARLGAGGGEAVAPVELKAGDNLRANAGAVSRRLFSPTDLADALAWRDGQIVFKDVPLREVLARFARYHGRGITATPDAAELSVGARYSLDDLDGFFESLESALPVQVSRNLNGTVQVSRRPEL